MTETRSLKNECYNVEITIFKSTLFMKLTHSYFDLGNKFFELNRPASVRSPSLFLWNASLAKELDLGELNDDLSELAQYFSGSMLLPNSKPLSMVYAGHQFGHYNPQLGDGRAHLLGEVIDNKGKLWDIHLKGSGQTAFSRNGDGRCSLGPAIREFIMSEALYFLGVPTTRCLAVIKTGEPVFRQDVKDGAVVTRIASSHIRVGTFQYFAANGDIESLQTLTHYSIKRHFPEILDSNINPYLGLLESVIDKQIELIVHWLRIGFIHGVMNTDNTAISGETIDFGPCAMLGAFDPKTVYSSIDRGGRYAFGNQGQIAHWNMARFAESLLQLADDKNKLLEPMQSLIDGFTDKFNQSYLWMMNQKLGLQHSDAQLINELCKKMQSRQLDYTATFDLLTRSLTCDNALTEIEGKLGDWVQSWRRQLNQANFSDTQSKMRKMNPVVIPRNHIVEQVLTECEQTGTPDAALNLLKALKKPYQQSDSVKKYTMPDPEFDANYQTFCGT